MPIPRRSARKCNRARLRRCREGLSSRSDCSGHTVLTGYCEAQIYDNIANKGSDLLSSALDALLPSTVSIDAATNSHVNLLAVSTTTLPRRNLAKVPLAAARALSDAAIQPSRGDGDASAYVVLEVGEKGGLFARSITSDEVHKAGWNVRGGFRSVPFVWIVRRS